MVHARTVANIDINQKDDFIFQVSRSCITEINKIFKNNTADINMVMTLCNLLGYSHSYSITSGKLWNYFRDEIDGTDDYVSDGKSFEYKTKLIGNTPV